MDYYNGVVKIKDGLFIGNSETGEDFEFLTNNKVTHIINCAGSEQPNLWETSGISYLTYPWYDNSVQRIFDEDDSVLQETCVFIQSAIDNGESCLIWSIQGTSRSACLAAGYLMYTYSWSLYKALEYLNSRKPDMSLSPNFVHQLFKLQQRLAQVHKKPLTCSWQETSEDPEDLVLKNTFLNSQKNTKQKFDVQKEEPKIAILTWADELDADKENHPARRECKVITTRSCLKGRGDKLFTFDCGSRNRSFCDSDRDTSFLSDDGDKFRSHRVLRDIGKGPKVEIKRPLIPLPRPVEKIENRPKAIKIPNSRRTTGSRTPSPFVIGGKSLGSNRMGRPWK